MSITSQTLLLQIKAGSQEAWERLHSIYHPFISRWLRQGGVRNQDAEDLTQRVLQVLVSKLSTFEHSGRAGAFRHWLRTIVVQETKKHWRTQARRGAAVGGTDFQNSLSLIEDENGELTRLWNQEHDDYVLQVIMQQVTKEFEPETLEAFTLLTVKGLSATEVADKLEISTGAVYVSKSRVLRRLRSEASGLIDSLENSQ